MSNRCKILRISNGFLPCILGKNPLGFTEVDRDPLPPDARIVNVRMRQDFQTIEILVESDEFEEVREGSHYPEIEPMLRTVCIPDRSRFDAWHEAEHKRYGR